MPATRRVVLAALLVLAVAGCGGDEADPGADGQQDPAAESSADEAPDDDSEDGSEDSEDDSGGGDGAASDGADVEATVAVEGGQVRGGTERVEAAVGDTVALTVTSDVRDTVHVHGYDLEQPVGPGEPVRLEFTADIPGVFEVELHDSGLKLADLEVGG